MSSYQAKRAEQKARDSLKTAGAETERRPFTFTNGGARRSVGERLMQKVLIRSDRESCWLWSGAVSSRGYGVMATDEGSSDSPHRVSFRLFVGPIADDLHVLHSCDEPLCVKPSHLFLGTNSDNIADKMLKLRQSRLTGQQNGRARLTADQVIFARSSHMATRDLASMFGVCEATIRHAINGKTWKHI